MEPDERTAKRARTELVAAPTSAVAIREHDDDDERTSALTAPIMLLAGHKAPIYSLKFDPSGEFLASGSSERLIFLWNVYGDCANYNVLAGHKNAVLEVHWLPDGQSLASASADKTVALWDANKGKRTKKLAGHTGVVNSVHVARRGEPLVVSGSDDGTVRLWDARERRSIIELDSEYAVTAVSFADDEQFVFSGGIDNVVKAWDLRMHQLVYTLEGHGDTITGLSVSPDGSFLLSNAMDSTLRSWDVRPFVEGAREQKRFLGLQHNVQKTLLKCAWSPDGAKVSAGSSDQIVRCAAISTTPRHRPSHASRTPRSPPSFQVHIFDVDSQEELYHLPGHKGSVNEVVFHPKEPIIGSCSADGNIFLGEIAA